MLQKLNCLFEWGNNTLFLTIVCDSHESYCRKLDSLRYISESDGESDRRTDSLIAHAVHHYITLPKDCAAENRHEVIALPSSVRF